MECDTLIRIDPESGERITKPKKSFDTLKEAIAACKKLNAKPDRINKVVSYKCKSCHKYHIGRNGKEIKDKYRDKLNKELNRKKPKSKANYTRNISEANFKIVGKIDLDKIPKK